MRWRGLPGQSSKSMSGPTSVMRDQKSATAALAVVEALYAFAEEPARWEDVIAAIDGLPDALDPARDAVAQRIEGLNLGADDYVVKPVDLDELAARLHALVRRAHGKTQTTLQLRDVVMDPSARQVSRDGEVISLSTREFDLLKALLLNAGRVLSREQLEQHLYRWGHEVESNTIEVHIHHLRRKMGAGLIDTVRGVGYIVMP